MYRVIHKFKDLKDNDHIYNVGDEYPREGLKPTKKRIEELSGEKNKIGEELIEEVVETAEETIEEVTTEEIVEQNNE